MNLYRWTGAEQWQTLPKSWQYGFVTRRWLPLNVAVLSETVEGEKRVALVPEVAKQLIDRGFKVTVESGAGKQAGFPDSQFTEAGATVVPTAKQAIEVSDVVLRVTGPTDKEVQPDFAEMKSGQVLISFINPGANPRSTAQMAKQGITSFAMELIPRITRAQSMDALSSMSTIAGYKGALLAANHSGKFFPMFMTAAGTMTASKVLIIGAGVAGLQAIATCRRLGAIVEAFDVRPAVKEQVESLGAKFVAMHLVTDDAEDASGYAKGRHAAKEHVPGTDNPFRPGTSAFEGWNDGHFDERSARSIAIERHSAFIWSRTGEN
jgi:NAD(P) transhydrogenase subunit alpha